MAAAYTAGTPAGLILAGNIDINSRPLAWNADDTLNERSMVWQDEDNGNYVLLNGVGDYGDLLSAQDALAAYQFSGLHLGIFDTLDHAQNYRSALVQHERALYAGTSCMVYASVNFQPLMNVTFEPPDPNPLTPAQLAGEFCGRPNFFSTWPAGNQRGYLREQRPTGAPVVQMPLCADVYNDLEAVLNLL